jgi:hypothetical protein
MLAPARTLLREELGDRQAFDRAFSLGSFGAQLSDEISGHGLPFSRKHRPEHVRARALTCHAATHAR